MPRKKPAAERSKSYKVRRVLADGREREYVYERKTPKRKGIGYTPDSIASVIDRWQNSPEWRGYAPATVKSLTRSLTHLDEYRTWDIGDMRRATLLDLRDMIASTRGNAAANAFIAAAGSLFTFALDRGYRDDHPLMRVRKIKGGEYSAWPEEVIAYALEHLPGYLRRATVLGLYTGQRSGDCARMRWDDYDGGGIAVAQQKTGAKVWVPCHADLRAELEAWPRDAVTILTNLRGRPWPINSFQQTFHRALHKHDELSGYQFHGLRKSAAARLAEAGCSMHEIQSVTGHASLSMVQHYTKAADQRVRASAAIVKLEAFAKRVRNELSD